MKRGILAALVAAWLLPGQALAQNIPQGFYVEGRGGATFAPNIDIDDEPSGFVAAGGDIDIDLKTGWQANGAVGYATSIGWRLELEGGYRQNSLDEVELSIGGRSVSTADLDGKVKVATGMLNGYFDLDPSLYGAGNWPIIPFIGAGVGAALVEIDDSVGSSDDEDLAFAYQLIAGLSYLVGQNLTVSVSYAYLDTAELDFDDVEFDYRSHSIMGGLRITF